MPDTARAGFCRQCGQNVWLTPEGGGYCGHPASEIVNVYETPIPVEPPVAAPIPVQQPVAPPIVAPIPVQPPVAPPIAAPIPVQPPVASRPKRSPLKWILAAVGVLVVIALVVVFFPRPDFVASAFDVPESITSGEDAVVSVDLANKGLLGGDCDLTVLIDEQPVQTKTVKLAAGENQRVEISIPDLPPGTYDLVLADWDGLAGELWVKTLSDFTVESVNVTPNPLDIAKSSNATVRVSVTNAGETGGDYNLSVTLDGASLADRSVFVEGGSTTEESFDISIDGAGDREIAVNGVTADLAVYKIERPGNGKVFVNKLTGGSNQMKIINNFADDYLVVLTAPGEGKPALLSVYVKSKSSTTVKGIKSGTYSVLYAYGANWCSFRKQFTDRVGYGRFETDSKYTSSSSQYTIFTYTFGASGGAGVPTSDVNANDFPKI
ncbi:MAG: hypothetical protein CVT59_04650 [Actinobacteria bacterium HGW-Actinobacteria-1]|jgi:hypothetical protein|nr:MAG: hypothetical protein CVT59_04650 [Actinobacteria bacterium HGW-Actinobacteria-1]